MFARAGLLLAALLLLLLLAGCGASPSPTVTASGPTRAPAATRAQITPTLLPSNTPTPARTADELSLVAAAETASASASLAQTPSPSAAPIVDPALSKVKLVGLSWLEKYKYNLLLSFDFPGPVDPADYRVTLEDKEYRCEVLGQYPNRLYCNGQGAKVLQPAQVRIYAAGSDQPGFETEVWVPYFQ